MRLFILTALAAVMYGAKINNTKNTKLISPVTRSANPRQDDIQATDTLIIGSPPPSKTDNQLPITRNESKGIIPPKAQKLKEEPQDQYKLYNAKNGEANIQGLRVFNSNTSGDSNYNATCQQCIENYLKNKNNFATQTNLNFSSDTLLPSAESDINNSKSYFSRSAYFQNGASVESDYLNQQDAERPKSVDDVATIGGVAPDNNIDLTKGYRHSFQKAMDIVKEEAVPADGMYGHRFSYTADDGQFYQLTTSLDDYANQPHKYRVIPMHGFKLSTYEPSFASDKPIPIDTNFKENNAGNVDRPLDASNEKYKQYNQNMYKDDAFWFGNEASEQYEMPRKIPAISRYRNVVGFSESNSEQTTKSFASHTDASYQSSYYKHAKSPEPVYSLDSRILSSYHEPYSGQPRYSRVASTPNADMLSSNIPSDDKTFSERQLSQFIPQNSNFNESCPRILQDKLTFLSPTESPYVPSSVGATIFTVSKFSTSESLSQKSQHISDLVKLSSIQTPSISSQKIPSTLSSLLSTSHSTPQFNLQSSAALPLQIESRHNFTSPVVLTTSPQNISQPYIFEPISTPNSRISYKYVNYTKLTPLRPSLNLNSSSENIQRSPIELISQTLRDLQPQLIAQNMSKTKNVKLSTDYIHNPEHISRACIVCQSNTFQSGPVQFVSSSAKSTSIPTLSTLVQLLASTPRSVEDSNFTLQTNYQTSNSAPTTPIRSTFNSLESNSDVTQTSTQRQSNDPSLVNYTQDSKATTISSINTSPINVGYGHSLNKTFTAVESSQQNEEIPPPRNLSTANNFKPNYVSETQKQHIMELYSTTNTNVLPMRTGIQELHQLPGSKKEVKGWSPTNQTNPSFM